MSKIPFDKDTYKDGSPKFIEWLILQSDRNDLVGFVASDVKQSIHDDGLAFPSTFDTIWKHVESLVDKTRFFIQHDDEIDPINKRKNIEEEIGRKLHDQYVDTVSPLMCLLVAWDEYEQSIKRKQLLSDIKKLNIESGYVYFIGLANKENLVKIGYSSTPNFKKRQKTIETSSPFDTVLLGYIQSERYKELEREIHSTLGANRKRREWFSISTDTAQRIIKENGGTISTV